MTTPTYLIVTVMCDDNDEPERPLVDIADDILHAGIEGVVSIRAAHNDTMLCFFAPVGPEYLA